MDLFGLLWLFFLFSAIFPMFRQHSIERKRLDVLHAIERKRKSRVITLIHRQEALSLFGIPLRRFINIEDSEEILRAIRMTPDDMPIDIILHTPGGLVLASEQIAHAIRRHPAKVTVFIPHYAMSGGTLIAMAADQIVMDENAVLGPVDPQLGNYPAVSIIKAVEAKDINEVDDETLILADVARKAVKQLHEVVYQVLAEKFPPEKAREITNALTCGQWTHDYPITTEKLTELGFELDLNVPEEVYRLMELYPQPQQRRPSVQFVPIPYHGKEGQGGR
ncbi:MAG: hypothetical protein GX058_06725 [Firmicutes bacterium]|nr:hypothetical protein [Bacillota bacterium]